MYISNKWYSPKNHEKKSTKIWSSTNVFDIDHNQKYLLSCKSSEIIIIMISERSRDPEDWSNDAENSAAHHINKISLFILYFIEPWSHRTLLKS